jgi:hypothetical protein
MDGLGFVVLISHTDYARRYVRRYGAGGGYCVISVRYVFSVE